MRIISDKRDYYDCIQAHGQDRSLVYLRKTEEVHLKRGEWPFPSLYSSWWFSDTEVTQHIIGFCGKIYPMLEMHGYSRVRDDPFRKKCFTIEEVDAFVEEHASQSQKDSYYGKGRWWRSSGKRRREFFTFFERCEKRKESYTEMFLEKLVPVFVAITFNQNSKIVYNAILRPYDFVRIFDPYSAFQEISMFMGSMAMPEKVMPIIPDELKLRSKGFSDQSFRAPFKDAKRVPK